MPATTDPRLNTKVDTLAEAIEDLAVSIAANLTGKDPDLRELVDVARGGLRSALRAFLVPSFNLIEGGARVPYTNDQNNVAFIPHDDRVKCAACNRHFICGDVNCPDWHKAIRAKVAQPIASGDDVA